MSASATLRARFGVVATAVALTALAVAGGVSTASASAPQAAYGCTRTVSGTTVPPQFVGAGEKLCLMSGAIVGGTVTVAPGGALLSQSSTINGAVNLNGATSFTVCNSTIIGAITAAGTLGPTSLGDNHLCAGTYIDGAVTLTDSTGALRLAGNTVTGAVTVNGNSTGATAGPRIAANTIGGALSCATNAPRPTNTGRLNTVVDARSGQCLAATF